MSIVNVEALKGLGNVLWWTGNVATANSPKSISANGDCKQILPFPGAGIGMFDGTGDYLLNTDTYQFTTGLSIEFLCRFNVVGTAQTILHFATANNYGIQFQLSATNYIATYISSADASWNINSTASSTTVIAANTWYHVALVWTGTTYTLYINGAVERTFSSSAAPASTSNLNIGRRYAGTPDQYVNGQLSEFHISSVARYTSAFTPIRRQLESDSNTKLLIHFNRNDTTFIDSSPSAHTITRYGDAKQLCSPCGSGIASFDGTGDALTFPAFDLSTGNFTYECTFKINATGSPLALINRYYYTSTNKNVEWSIHYTGTYIAVQINTGSTTSYTIIGTTVISTSTLYHVALVRNGSVFTLYVNGVSEGTPITNASALTYYSGRSGNVGRLYEDGYIWHLNGYISEVRLSNTARYTTTFTPSTQPFKPDPYTKLLLHMDGVTNGFYDSSDPPGDNGFLILPDGVTVTPSGTFTTQKMKDGRNIWAFDGSTNYITISDHASWSMFLNDFTIAAWIKFDSIVANRTIIGQYTDANNQWFVRWTTGNLLQLFGVISGTSTFSFTCPMTPVAGTWYHVVVQRSGSSCIIYINGVAQTVTQSAAFSATATNIAAVLSIGNIYSEYQAGNTKDLQIFTKALTMDQVSALYQETYIY